MDIGLRELIKENARLSFENSVLKQKNWAKPDKNRITAYFLLVNTRYKPETQADVEWATGYCHEMMEQFAREIGTIITFNKKGHSYTPEYITNVRIRYVVELGRGRLKKDGTRGKSGGTIHIHIYLTIWHTSNITVTHDSIVDFFQPLVWAHFGIEKVFVGRPRLIAENNVEQYMLKDTPAGSRWTTIDL